MIDERYLKLLDTVEVPNYPRQIMTSKARRPKYYTKDNKKIPKKYLSKIGIDYQWVDFTVTKKGKPVKVPHLVTIDTKERVVSNPRSAGTPKYLTINGQKLHQLTLRDYERYKILDVLKGAFAVAVSNLKPIHVKPLVIIGELRDTYYDEVSKFGGKTRKDTGADWDVDNRILFYNKTFLDVLTGAKAKNHRKGKIEPTMKVIIPDDHRGIVTMPPSLIFTPIKEGQTRKLVYRIYQDLRPDIVSSEHYMTD